MLKEYDEGFKVIFAGSSGVGKSSLLFRFVENNFSNNLLSTIGVDFKFKTIEVQGRKIKMQIWDTAGSEAFRSIVSAYYRGANAVVLVYSICDRLSFKEMTDFWIEEVNKHKDPECQIMILGNKSDMEHDAITEMELKNFMNRQKISLYRQTSAKTGNQVSDAFKSLAERLVTKKGGAKNVGSGLKEKIKKPEEAEVARKSKCCK